MSNFILLAVLVCMPLTWILFAILTKHLGYYLIFLGVVLAASLPLIIAGLRFGHSRFLTRLTVLLLVLCAPLALAVFAILVTALGIYLFVVCFLLLVVFPVLFFLSRMPSRVVGRAPKYEEHSHDQ